MPKFEIPESWAETTLGIISDFKNGRGFKSSEWKNTGLPIIRIQNVNATDPNETKFNYFSGDYDENILVQTGDLLFCWSGSLGTSFGPRIWLGPTGVLNQHIFKVLLKGEIERKFYFFQMKANIGLVEQRAHGGVGLTHITKAELIKVPFVMPPPCEQKRIVTKIEAVQEKIKTIEQNVTAAEGLISKYRETLLKKAFRGELVSQNPNDEPASKLLESIRRERARQTDGKKKIKNDLPLIKPGEIPFEIPKSWEWVRLGTIGDLARGKSKHRPRNEPKLFGGKYPFIQTGDVAAANGGVIETFEQTLSEFGLQQSRLFKKGTLCITIAANIANTAVLGFESAFPDSIVGFTPLVDKEIFPHVIKFVQFYIEATKDEIDRKAQGAAQKNINLNFLELLLVPLPSRNGLINTVNVISKAITKTHKFSTQLSKTRQSVSLIQSAILTSAISGRLVVQDSSEGTGHELVEKIIKSSKPAPPLTAHETKQTSSKNKIRTKK